LKLENKQQVSDTNWKISASSTQDLIQLSEFRPSEASTDEEEVKNYKNFNSNALLYALEDKEGAFR
jgi:hypothetical protein